MLEMLSYGFMRRAVAVIIVIAVTAPLVGMPIVMKRLSSVGEAASHSALAGVAAGLLLNVNPVLGAVIFAVLAVLGIEGFRKAFSKFSEIAPVVVTSAGIGLTAVLSGFVPGGAGDLNSFMFGSVVAVSDFETALTVGLSLLVTAFSVIFYRYIFAVTFDEEAASIAGFPVKRVNFMLMLLTAVTVAVSSRVVGALMISSLLVIPTAAAMLIGKSYKKTMLWSVAFAEMFSVSGLIVSSVFNLRPAGTIVLIGVAALMVLMIFTGRDR